MCSGKVANLSLKPEIGNHILSTSYDKLLRRQATTVVLRKARHLAWQEERHGTNKGRQMGSSNFHPNCTSFHRRCARASFLLLLERRRRLCLFSLQNGDGVSSAGLGRVRQYDQWGNQYAHRCCLKVRPICSHLTAIHLSEPAGVSRGLLTALSR